MCPCAKVSPGNCTRPDRVRVTATRTVLTIRPHRPATFVIRPAWLLPLGVLLTAWCGTRWYVVRYVMLLQDIRDGLRAAQPPDPLHELR